MRYAPQHDDDPLSLTLPEGVKLRQTLLRMLALAAATAVGSTGLQAFAQTPSSSPLAAVPMDAFMAVSHALTARDTLDADVGARLLTAVQAGEASFAPRLQHLAAVLSSGAMDADAQKLALRIMSAWYVGIVDDKVITYEQALMFDLVSDTLVIRTYCPGKPGFWAQKPVEKDS